MLRKSDNAEAFSMAEARAIVADLFEPRPVVYWTDFLLSAAVAFASLAGLALLVEMSWTGPLAWVVWCLLFVVCALSAYRAALFTHELAHFRRGTFQGFRLTWNALFGIPLLMPSFLYHTHSAHHARPNYGTARDGEYLPLVEGSRWYWLLMLVEPWLMPVVAVSRFLILTPLSWLIPSLRRWLERRVSALAIAPEYERPAPLPAELRSWRVQEAACFAAAVIGAVLLASGLVSPLHAAQIYAIAVFALTINAVRTLGAHRYRHGYSPTTFIDQMLDSVNYPQSRILGPLWAPLGLRFHATHHLFPSLPYHALGEAHRRLMAQLPADSLYRSTESPSLWATLIDNWRGSRERSSTRRAAAHQPPSGRQTARARV